MELKKWPKLTNLCKKWLETVMNFGDFDFMFKGPWGSPFR